MQEQLCANAITFDFHGHQVAIRAEPVAGGWSWTYTMDGRIEVRKWGGTTDSARSALEEAGMRARDIIRVLSA